MWVVCLAGSAAAAAAAEIQLNADQIRLLEIRTAPAAPATKLRLAGLPAEIEIAAAAQRGVAAPFAGQVLVLHAGVGDRVAAGAPLADLGSAEYAAASARQRQAQANAERARAQVTRDRQLHDEGVIARARLEASEADWQAARATLQAEEAALVGSTALGGGRYRLLAPIAGVVLTRTLRMDTPVAAWSGAFVIADPTQLVAQIDVPADRAATLRVGDALAIGSARGRVQQIAAAVDRDRQSVRVSAPLETLGDLRSGQRASAEVQIQAPPGSYALPRTALWFEGNAARVFVAGEAGHFRSVEVVVLDQDATIAVVRGELIDGAVVTHGVAALKALRETP